MIDLYLWNTPNGYKPIILAEELGISYKLHPVNIGKGEQLAPDFLKLSPNNKIPAMIDTAPVAGGEPMALFESGAILCYLAEREQKFLPSEIKARYETLQWVFWQVGGLGPMSGQAGFFLNSAAEGIELAINRFVSETKRLYGVLNGRLDGRDYITGEYSIADITCATWVSSWKRSGIDITEFPNVEAWHARVYARPAVIRALEAGDAMARNA